MTEMQVADEFLVFAFSAQRDQEFFEILDRENQTWYFFDFSHCLSFQCRVFLLVFSSSNRFARNTLKIESEYSKQLCVRVS